MDAQGIAERAQVVRAYHALSTHRAGRFAPGPGRLDWRNQPDPFRVYEGAPRVELPLGGDVLSASWGGLHEPGEIDPRPLDRSSLGAFLELALGLTAWKEFGGSRWALRANPSSGNLHPTEGYVVLPGSTGLPAGAYHYLSREHLLERRLTPSAAVTDEAADLLGWGGFLFGLSSIHWREAWKYGARAYRYCQHDVGHSLAAARYAAGVLGWSARLLAAPGDEDVAVMLGLDREEDFAGMAGEDREHPDALLLVGPSPAVDDRAARIEEAIGRLVTLTVPGQWAGRPNPLSPEHLSWPMVDAVAAATHKPRTVPSRRHTARAIGSLPSPSIPERAARLIRRRRSAVDMDGETAIAGETFYGMLARLLPCPELPPWDALPWAPRVHGLFFVHRIEGLARGLYLLERDAEAHDALRDVTRAAFSWTRPDGCPEELPFFLLEAGDARPLARLASCGQDIASDSAFAVAMIAEMGPAIDEAPWAYRQLHWEAGMLGQVLYLEAEAAGVRGTGIGCFLDDAVHDLLGLGDDRFRDIYHFTVGGPVEDERLTTLPGYGPEVAAR